MSKATSGHVEARANVRRRRLKQNVNVDYTLLLVSEHSHN